MAHVGEVVTPGGTTVRLAMKVAVAVGPARRFVVGDPDIQLIDVLAGQLVDELAAAEHLAEQGEVVLEQSALDALGERVDVAEIRIDEESGRRVALVTGLSEAPPESPAAEPEHPLPDELVRPWLLPAVYERLRTGRGEFLAELRPATPVFVRFTGIDYDADDDAIEKLDDFVRRAQRVFADFGGNLLQLTLGDKGAYLYAVFGSPHAHEDDAARACAAALEIVALDGVTAARELQVGIAHGRLRSGTYGHAMRRTFVCLGDAVNLAARLMSRAAPGQVFVAEAVRRQAGEAFVVGAAARDGSEGEGRADHRLRPDRCVTHVRRGAGRGTHCRSWAAARSFELSRRGSRTPARVGDASSGCLPRRAWGSRGSSRSSCARFAVAASSSRSASARRSAATRATASGARSGDLLLGVGDELPDAELVIALREELERIDPALVPRAPLLATLLGISIPDNELTRSFDAELRKTSLEALLVDCLRARAAEVPLVLVLEDCHWIDPLSRDLLELLAREAASLRVLVVLAYRPAAEPGGGLGIARFPHFAEVPLAELEPEEAAELIRSKLEQLLGEGAEAPPALVELVTARSQGNPFYVEELLNFIQGQGVDIGDEAAIGRLQLPESLHSLILSRIDTLSEEPRRTLKVASVVGRTFAAPALPAVYPELGSLEDVRAHLAALGSLDLVRLDREEHEEYIFKHVVTQEVAYESMPFAIRATLHEHVGEHIEETEPDAVERNLDLLAHHFWLSENLAEEAGVPRARRRRGEGELRQRGRDRLLRARRPAPRGRGAMARSHVRWARSGKVPETATAPRLRTATHSHSPSEADDASAAGWTETSLAELARKRGDYDEAPEWLDAAEAQFRSGRTTGSDSAGSSTSAASSPTSAATAQRPAGTWRRASRSGAKRATRWRWGRCTRISRSSPSTKGTTSARARCTRKGSRCASRQATRRASPSRR